MADPKPPSPPLREGEDYVIDEFGRLVFTRGYHLKRGYCCESGCRNCPYGFQAEDAKKGGKRP